MKKFLFLFFVIASVAAQSQTVSEISRMLNSGPKFIASTTAGALNADLVNVDLNTAGYKLISVTVSGTWVGTISFQGSTNNTSWNPIAVNSPDVPGAYFTTATTNGHFNIPTTGFRYIRARMTAYTSGTASGVVHGFFGPIDPPGISTVSITGTVPVSISGSMPVTGPLTDAQLRASAVPVSVSGSMPVTGPLTDAQLRATAVPVSMSGTMPISASALPLPTGATTEATLSTLSGKIPANLTVTATRLLVDPSGVTQPVSGPLTDAQARAFANGVSLSASSITALNGDAFSIDLVTGAPYRGIGVTLTGAWSATLTAQGSHDNSNWNTIMVYNPSAGVVQSTMFANGSYNIPATGFRYVRLRATSFTSGTVVVAAYGFTGSFDMAALSLSGSVSLNGTSSMNVAQINGVTPLMGNGVTGTGSQRVTIASDNTAFPVNANLQAGSNLVGKVGIDQTTVGTTNGVSLAQIGAITVATGNGIAGTGVQRVAIASDNTAFSVNNTQQGTASQNVAQVNGVTTLTGNGVTGTGSQRVTIASDNTAISVNNTQVGTASENTAQIAGNTVATGNGVVGTGVQRVAIASDNTAFAVNATGPTLTKGTQGSTGFSTQDLKDAGRTTIALTIEAAGAATTEGLATVTESRNGAATATFTSKVITSGKKIRFQSVAMEVETLGSGTAPQRVWLRLRVNTAGATTTSSPQQSVWSVVNNTAVVKSGATAFFSVLDGLEYTGDGTATYGLTLTFPDWVATTGTVQVKITIFAFEY
jgi:hypothetical protein